jgi:RNA polymerase sigma factor (sigma-70 family)
MSHDARDQEPYDIEALYRRFGPMVLRRGRRFLPPEAAEDVLHEVFVRVLERFDAFRHEASPATWLFAVTTRLCLNRLRDAKRRGELLERHAPALRGLDGASGGPEQAALLRELWARILDDDEEVAMIGALYHVDGMTTADIGAMLGVSDRTVANRLTRLGELARRHTDGPAPTGGRA